MYAGNITTVADTNSSFHSDLITITNPKNHIGCVNPRNSQRNFSHSHLEYFPSPSYDLLPHLFDSERVALSLHYFSICSSKHYYARLDC